LHPEGVVSRYFGLAISWMRWQIVDEDRAGEDEVGLLWHRLRTSQLAVAGLVHDDVVVIVTNLDSAKARKGVYGESYRLKSPIKVPTYCKPCR
jgi:hypothetical protein